MDIKELQDILSTLEYTSYKLEETYVENDGEVTEETELMEGEITAMKTLLNTEGVDLLGRWLKGKEDRKKALKAEKDYLTRQMEAIDKTIEFIKTKMNEVMTATGQVKIKGSLGYSFALSTSRTTEGVKGEYGYSFATFDSVKTEVDKDLLNTYFLARVQEAVKDILPADVTITLGASVSKLEDGEILPDYYNLKETPSIRFTKPRAKKGEE